MTTRHWLAYALRLMAVAYFGLTAIYGLMYFMPFTYVQLLESELVPELVGFARWHAWLFLPLAMLVDLGPAVGQLSPLAFRLRQGYRVAVVITGLLLLAFPVLPTLQNDLSSFLWAQASLIPLLWLAAIDLAAVGDRLHWDESPGTGETRPLLAAVTGAGFAWVLSMGILALRPEVATALATTELGFAVTWSIGAHLVVFLALATGALVIRGLAALTRRPPRTEALLATAGLVLLVAAALRTGFFAALAFNGRLADLGSRHAGASDRPARGEPDHADPHRAGRARRRRYHPGPRPPGAPPGAVVAHQPGVVGWIGRGGRRGAPPARGRRLELPPAAARPHGGLALGVRRVLRRGDGPPSHGPTPGARHGRAGPGPPGPPRRRSGGRPRGLRGGRHESHARP